MKITEIVNAGELAYTHHYMQTMTSECTCDHVLTAPKMLITLAKNAPGAQVVSFGDGSLGIEIDGKMWAIELPDNPHYQHAEMLPRKTWRYISLALGRNADTCSD